MTPRWLLRYAARLDVVAMRLAYPSEDKNCATYATADDDGTYRLWVLTPGRLEWWVQMEWERTAGNPASPVEYD